MMWKSKPVKFGIDNYGSGTSQKKETIKEAIV